MTKSNPERPERKSHPKPYPEFPLGTHPQGYWVKRIKGKLHYFGRIKGDEFGEQAHTLWKAQKDDLLAGRPVEKPKADTEVVTVADAVNHFLHSKKLKLEADELSQRTWDYYEEIGKHLIKLLGRNRSVTSLCPTDFQTLRAKYAKMWGATRLGNAIGVTRSIFNYCLEAELIDKKVRCGPDFKKPTAKTLRKAREASGPQMFDPADLRKLIKHANPNGKAMILLGVNGGLGNTDLALLTLAALDLDGGWLDYPRNKTGIHRRIPLWKETIEALREAIAARPTPQEDAKDFVFIARRGETYLAGYKGTRVVQEYQRAAKAAEVKGRSFYDLRRTFQTIGEEAGDLVAVQSIMGHAPATGDMSARYRQKLPDDARLRAVADKVRGWLYGGEEAAQAPTLRAVG